MLRLTKGRVVPHPDRVGEIEWALRYDPEGMTRSDQLVAASALALVQNLVSMGPSASGDLLAAIRRAVRQEARRGR